jgi:NAD(P) transhydrogenase
MALLLRAATAAAARAQSATAAQWQAAQRRLQNLAIGVAKETSPLECRVALAPPHAAKLVKAGAKVHVEQGAGLGAGFRDEEYVAAGATIVPTAEAWKQPLVAKVLPPTLEEAARIQDRAILSIIQPRVRTDLYDQLTAQKATVLSLDSLLRTLSRGQAYDVLSSQANVAGYRVRRTAPCLSPLPPFILLVLPAPRPAFRP